MFAARYFNPRYWAKRFWPKVGGLPPSPDCFLAFQGKVEEIKAFDGDICDGC